MYSTYLRDRKGDEESVLDWKIRQKSNRHCSLRYFVVNYQCLKTGGVLVSTGICLVQTAVEWLRNNQLNLNGKTKLANLFGGNQRMAFAA